MVDMAEEKEAGSNHLPGAIPLGETASTTALKQQVAYQSSSFQDLLPSSSKTDILSSSSNLKLVGEEFRFGSLVFTSKFDSGNLANVEKVSKDPSNEGQPRAGYLEPVADMEYNLWTRPDCAGTPFENGNRSWFYFGIRGFTPGKLIKINLMNMNRQGKLYSQGHSPIIRVMPHKPKWERLKDRCTFEAEGGDFVLSFHYRFPEQRGTAYFAFCFPWSYTESQEQMAALDKQYPQEEMQDVKNISQDSIYYYREHMTTSLDGLRVDLMTISSHHGITGEREPRYDKLLFPDKNMPRCHNFRGKKVYVLTSRVHPGESPASAVFNGFLEFILRPNDKRAQQLRKQYVFKMIPMLNPDGVVRGHYRTDPQGVNLNRMYQDPVHDLYPSIYAAKSLLVFHHINNCSNKTYIPDLSVIFKDVKVLSTAIEETHSEQIESPRTNSDSSSPILNGINNETTNNNYTHENTLGGINRCSSAESECQETQPTEQQQASTQHLNDARLLFIPYNESGIAFYVDLHGHASKRGCFIYGNHFTEEEKAILNLLFPKLIALNSAHFDFSGCNFTERNMYTKDKRDGQSKEGSGRVAIHKSIGIIHSYTLECNYNSGRLVNSIAPGAHDSVTPPPLAAFPPKYTQAHFEEVGRALAVAAIDYTDSNPWSRLHNSELPGVHAVKEWVRRSLRGGRGVARYNKPSLPFATKFNNKGNSNPVLPTSKSDPAIRYKMAPPQSPNASAAVPTPAVSQTQIVNGHSFGRTPRFAGASDPQPTRPKELGPVKEAKRRSFSLPSPSNMMKIQVHKNNVSLADISQTKSFSLRLMHTMSRQNNTTVQVMQSKIEDGAAKEQTNKSPTPNLNSHDQELLPAQPSRMGTLASIDPSELQQNSAIQKNKSVHKKIKKRSPANNTNENSDNPKDIGGVQFEPTTSKPSRLRKRSGKWARSRLLDNTVRADTNKRGSRSVIKGAPIRLSDRSRIGERNVTSGKRNEMDDFEKKLMDRISSMGNAKSFWVEL